MIFCSSSYISGNWGTFFILVPPVELSTTSAQIPYSCYDGYINRGLATFSVHYFYSLTFIMTLSFGRIEAGQYGITCGSKLVGYVKKQSSTKWILYKCSNLSMLGNPLAVKKTLTQVKAIADTFFVQELADADVRQLELNDKKEKAEEKKKTVMREMLERGNIHPEWKIDSIDIDDDNLPFNKFVEETDLVTL